MKIYIYSNSYNYVDYTGSITSEINIDERLDEVLDSGSFCMLVGNPSNAIEPFTRVIIEHDDGKQVPFFATSVCNKYLSEKNLFYHEVKLYEPTKIMECWLLGTKSFSIIDSKESYNSNYDRIRIICELMSDKYGIQINLDDRIKSMLKDREYSFGAGTTAFDAIYEIMKTENCIPRIVFSMIDSQNTFTLTFDKPQASIKYQKFTSATKVLSDNNVDEYCSEMEAEYGEVVDRDTLQECVLSCRSRGDVICSDTACLITPSPVEKLESVSLRYELEAQGTKICLIPKSIFDDIWTYCNHDGSGTFTKDGAGVEDIYHRVLIKDTSGYEDFFLGKLKAWYLECYNELIDWLIGIGWNRYSDNSRYLLVHVNCGGYFNLYDFDENIQNLYDNYYVVAYYDEPGFKGTPKENLVYKLNRNIDLTSRVLVKEKWDLLPAELKPKYVYWQSGGNFIDGFYNTFHDGFWESIFYDKVNPFLESFVEDGVWKRSLDFTYGYHDENMYSQYYYTIYYWLIVAREIKNLKFKTKIAFLDETYARFSNRINESSNQYSLNDAWTVANEFNIDTNHLKNVYEVKYYSKSPTVIRTGKETAICQTAASKSFNSGASTIDFNQLTPAIQRAVDMQGLEKTTIYAKDDFEVGSRTEYGYIISKSSTYKLIENGSILKSFVYNCCNNYQQVAAVIGVDSQYEATNIPQTGIVSRFLYDEIDDVIVKDKLYLGIKINSDDDEWLAKPLQMLETDGQRLFICQAEDNVSFDRYLGLGTNGTYFLNKIVSYSDADAYQIKYAEVAILTINDYSLGTLNYLPLISNDKVNIVAKAFENRNIYKDSRERLIFVLKHTGSLLK